MRGCISKAQTTAKQTKRDTAQIAVGTIDLLALPFRKAL
jgi:hypothetical protein